MSEKRDHVQKYVFRISATHQGASEHTTGHTVVWQIRESVPFTISADHPFRSEAPRPKLILNASRYLQLNDNQQVREMITHISADYISILL